MPVCEGAEQPHGAEGEEICGPEMTRETRAVAAAEDGDHC